ncbi:phosphatase 2C-like domain-containing protein [Mycena vitilis]|nr:phosphatase 2C-like domain-containing protein [Mycena vitilis]
MTTDDLTASHRALVEATVYDEIKGMQFVSLGGRMGTRRRDNLDRYFAAVWDLPNGAWKFALVLDGHGDTSTVDFVLIHYPGMVQSNLIAALDLCVDGRLSDGVLSRVLASPVIELDERIKNDVLDLVPANLEGFEPELVFKDLGEAVQRCHSGSTLCAALVDPAGRVHVASLGDCSSLLCLPTDASWCCKDMGVQHRTTNPLEALRIRNEHPNEPQCISSDSRLLTMRGGNLSRGLGDMHYKLPVHVTNMLFALSNETYALAEVTKTPPYMSHIPDVIHADASPGAFLILASDGLEDLARRVGTDSLSDIVTATTQNGGKIAAVELLWQAFGGDSDKNFYSTVVSGEYGRWRIDDITIAVVPL